MKKVRKENIVLVIVLILVIIFVVVGYLRYEKYEKDKQAAEEANAQEDLALDCYGYGGVEKRAYFDYKDLVDELITCYNECNGEEIAKSVDFAANAVLVHKGIEKFDENLYTLVTDAENYKDDYYANSMVVMCAMLLDDENEFIDNVNNYKVDIKLEELSDLAPVEGSKYLFAATAKMKINDKEKKQKFDSTAIINFITYDEGKTYYLLKVEENKAEETKK